MNKQLVSLGRGLVAGAVGTAAMDLSMYRRYRREGGEQPLVDWEFSAGLDSWDNAPAPALVGRRLVKALFRTDLDARWTRVTSNVMHWGTGMVWGAQYGLLLAVTGRTPGPADGPLLGSFVFANSYVVLPLLKLYKPIWEYDRATLAKDLSAHLVYGTVTVTAIRKLSGG